MKYLFYLIGFIYLLGCEVSESVFLYVSDVRITQSTDTPGFTNFTFEIKKSKNDSKTDFCNCEFEFMKLFEGLNYNNIKCWEIADSLYMLTAKSILWVGISEDDFEKELNKIKKGNIIFKIRNGDNELDMIYK